MALVRLPKKLRPPATKSGRLTPSKMRAKLQRERVWTNEDVAHVELEYIDVECKKQSYFATMKDGTRKRLTRCTSISGLLKSQALINWSARMAGDYVQANWKKNRGYSQARIDAICENARTAHERYKDFTADLGKDAHFFIEMWLQTGRWPDEIQHFLDTGEWPEWAELDPRVANSVTLFANEWHKRGLQVVATEFRLYDVRLMVGGTGDLIAYDPLTGEYYYIDHKTGNGIYESMLAQVSFYKAALIAMGERGFPISRVMIYRVGREDSLAQIVEISAEELDEAYECFELLAALRPVWNRLAGRCNKRNAEWREANGIERDRQDQIAWEGQDEAAA